MASTKMETCLMIKEADNKGFSFLWQFMCGKELCSLLFMELFLSCFYRGRLLLYWGGKGLAVGKWFSSSGYATLLSWDGFDTTLIFNVPYSIRDSDNVLLVANCSLLFS